MNVRLAFLLASRRLRWYWLQLKGWLVFGRRVGVIGDFHVGDPANIRIGRNCAINEGVLLLGHHQITIGDDVILSAGAMLIDAGLDSAKFGLVERPEYEVGEIVLEDGVWIGAGAIVLAGVRVGRKSIIGAGSVVTRDVPAFSVAVGNPARVRGRTDA